MEDERSGNALGNGRGQRHTDHVQLTDDDEEQVEQDVQHTGGAQIDQRLFCLANGTENGIAKVEQRQCGHSQEIHPQIEDGTGKQVFLGVQQPEQSGGAQQAHQQQDHACNDADDECRVNGLVDIVRVPGTVEPGHQHIDAVAQANEKAREQGDKDTGGTHRAQCRGARKAAYDRHVGHVEQHLQQVGEGQRQADQKDLFGQRALRQRFGIRFHSFLIPIFLNPKLCPRTPGQPLL